MFFAVLLVGTTCVAQAGDNNAKSEPVQVAQFDRHALDSTDDFDDFDDDYSDKPLVADPLYHWNLVWFNINDALYNSVAKPLAEGYDWMVPVKPRTWINNFFVNLLFPVRFLNDLLTGKFDAAFMETSKFVANTAFGLGGLGDVTADRPRAWEPERPTADGFGQTLGKAGIGHGVYLVWPFIGPSSIRESVGWLADAYCDPLTYGHLSLIELGAIWSFKNLNNLSLDLEGNEYDALTAGAVDKYAAVRDAYIRYRAKKVAE